MVATKFYSGHDEDSSINWAEYAKMTPDKLLCMELEFLSALDWKVYVSNEEFFKKVETIEKKLACRQGLGRGWFTYMELDSLLPSIKITKSFLHFTFIIGLSYTAFVATIVASVFLVSQIPGTYLNASSRKASISDAIIPINVQRTATHDPIIITDSVNSIKKPMSENHNNSGSSIHSQHINSAYIEMDTDLSHTQIDRLDDTQPNATQSNTENSVNDASVKTGTSNWSVIINSLATEKRKTEYHVDRFGHVFSKFKPAAPTYSSDTNSTIFYSILFQPKSAPFKNYFNGIKMKFV